MLCSDDQCLNPDEFCSDVINALWFAFSFLLVHVIAHSVLPSDVPKELRWPRAWKRSSKRVFLESPLSSLLP